MIRASVFVGVSVDGFLARLDGTFDFLEPAAARRTASRSSSPPSTSSSWAG
jgi:hypothetical protein